MDFSKRDQLIEVLKGILKKFENDKKPEKLIAAAKDFSREIPEKNTEAKEVAMSMVEEAIDGTAPSQNQELIKKVEKVYATESLNEPNLIIATSGVVFKDTAITMDQKLQFHKKNVELILSEAANQPTKADNVKKISEETTKVVTDNFTDLNDQQKFTNELKVLGKIPGATPTSAKPKPKPVAELKSYKDLLERFGEIYNGFKTGELMKVNFKEICQKYEIVILFNNFLTMISKDFNKHIGAMTIASGASPTLIEGMFPVIFMIGITDMCQSKNFMIKDGIKSIPIFAKTIWSHNSARNTLTISDIQNVINKMDNDNIDDSLRKLWLYASLMLLVESKLINYLDREAKSDDHLGLISTASTYRILKFLHQELKSTPLNGKLVYSANIFDQVPTDLFYIIHTTCPGIKSELKDKKIKVKGKLIPNGMFDYTNPTETEMELNSVIGYLYVNNGTDNMNDWYAGISGSDDKSHILTIILDVLIELTSVIFDHTKIDQITKDPLGGPDWITNAWTDVSELKTEMVKVSDEDDLKALLLKPLSKTFMIPDWFLKKFYEMLSSSFENVLHTLECQMAFYLGGPEFEASGNVVANKKYGILNDFYLCHKDKTIYGLYESVKTQYTASPLPPLKEMYTNALVSIFTETIGIKDLIKNAGLKKLNTLGEDKEKFLYDIVSGNYWLEKLITEVKKTPTTITGDEAKALLIEWLKNMPFSQTDFIATIKLYLNDGSGTTDYAGVGIAPAGDTSPTAHSVSVKFLLDKTGDAIFAKDDLTAGDVVLTDVLDTFTKAINNDDLVDFINTNSNATALVYHSTDASNTNPITITHLMESFNAILTTIINANKTLPSTGGQSQLGRKIRSQRGGNIEFLQWFYQLMYYLWLLQTYQPSISSQPKLSPYSHLIKNLIQRQISNFNKHDEKLASYCESKGFDNDTIAAILLAQSSAHLKALLNGSNLSGSFLQIAQLKKLSAFEKFKRNYKLSDLDIPILMEKMNMAF